MARPMPVLPDDGSRSVCPGVSVPSASASVIMFRAMRSLTEPPGFWPSSLARIRTAGLGLSWLTSTSGVMPMVSRIEPKAGKPRSAAGDGRQDGDHVGVLDGRGQLVEEPHVVVVAVHVHELVQGAVLGDDLAGEQRELAHEVVEQLTDGGAVGFDRRLAGGVLAEDSWQAHFDRHGGQASRGTGGSGEILPTHGLVSVGRSRTSGSSATFPSTMVNDRTTGVGSRSDTRM